MNKAGFTLIELLASISIMAIIATAASVNIIKVFNEKDKVKTETQNNILTTAACLYIELEKNKDLKETCLTEGCNITSNTLIDEGLINKEDVDKNTVITITKEYNTKICKIN